MQLQGQSADAAQGKDGRDAANPKACGRGHSHERHGAERKVVVVVVLRWMQELVEKLGLHHHVAVWSLEEIESVRERGRGRERESGGLFK